MRFLYGSTANDQISKPAAEAIESVCSKGATFLRDFFPELLKLVHKIEEAPQKGHLAEQSAQSVLRACAHLVNDLPATELAAKLTTLCEESLGHLIKVGFGGFKDGARVHNPPLNWIVPRLQ